MFAEAYFPERKPLSGHTRSSLPGAVVLAVQLYGAESWTIKAMHVRRLDSFRNSCVRTILGVTMYHQWKENNIVTVIVCDWYAAVNILEQRPRWLDHMTVSATQFTPHF